MATTVTLGEVPQSLDFVTKRGDTIGPYRLTFSVAVDDRTFTAQVRPNKDEDGSATAAWTIDDSQAADKIIDITLADSECAKLATEDGKATYYWDLQFTMNDASATRTWFAGKIKVDGDVTVVP